MKKLSTVLLALLLSATAVAGCSNLQQATQNNDPLASSTDITEISIDVNLDEPAPNVVNDVKIEPLAIEFETADRGRIFPNVVAYIEDEFVPELNEYAYSFIDMNGNIICEAVFDKVIYDKGSDAYIVRGTQDGVSKYGIISADGQRFTGLKFDGVASTYNFTGKPGFYGSNYVDGYLQITELDSNFNESDTVSITINQDELGVDPATSQLSVYYHDNENSIIVDQSEFYYNYWLIDNTNGKVLFSSNDLAMPDPTIFGNVIIEQETSGQGIVVRDMKGNKIIDSKDACSGRVTIDRYMVALDGMVNIYDTSWNVINTLAVPEASIVMTSFERIVVSTADKTVVYDKDLNEINTLDYMIYGGTYFRDWNGQGEGDFFYDSISGTNEVINLNTGAKLAKEDAFFYSFDYGYINCDNVSNGNDPVKKWRIYDSNMNFIASGEGSLNFIRDEKTGDVYATVMQDDVETVYSMDGFEELFTINGRYYNLTAYDGKFRCWNKQKYIFMDSEGNEITTYDVDYKKINNLGI